MGYEFDDTGIRVHRHRYTSSRHRYTSSQTPGDEFVDTVRRVTPQNVLAVYDFTDTGIRVHRHRYTSSQTPVYELQTPVYEFTDTGIRVHRHRKRESFAILGDLKLEIENFGNMGGLRIPPRYGIKQKKNFKNPVSLSL